MPIKKTAHFFKSKIWKSIKKLNHHLRSIELILVIIALVFAYEAYLDAKEQITIAQEEHKSRSISNAWMNLADRIPGNSGKVEALELLAKENKNLFAINMSEIKSENNSETMIEWWDNLFDEKTLNRNAIYLVDLDLSFDHIGHSTKLIAANFEGAILMGANFSGNNLTFASFKKAHLEGASFRGANISAVDFKAIEDAKNIDFSDCYIAAANAHDNKLLPIFDDRFSTKVNWKKAYIATSEEQRRAVLEQIEAVDQKIAEEEDTTKISDLKKARKELMSQQFLHEDEKGNLYKIEVRRNKES